MTFIHRIASVGIHQIKNAANLTRESPINPGSCQTHLFHTVLIDKQSQLLDKDSDNVMDNVGRVLM